MSVENQEFKKELEALINKYSIENESNTPDFILAQYIYNALYIFESAVIARDQWYGFEPSNETKINNLRTKIRRCITKE